MSIRKHIIEKLKGLEIIFEHSKRVLHATPDSNTTIVNRYIKEVGVDRGNWWRQKADR